MTTRFDPATRDELAWIAELEATHYAELAIPHARIEEWFDANPRGFFVLRDGETRVGHATFLPIRRASMQQLLDGTIGESALRADDLFAPQEAEDIRDVYLESIVAEGRFGEFTAALRTLIASFAPRAEMLYAFPGTPRGKRALARLGLRAIDRTASSAHPQMHGMRIADVP
ncbi:MAG: hypothetical protein JO197_20680 [Acidobacteria bacterium]|nr:hypothetical protein [Acidobacteriota bacterium]MBV9474483.1 hypothetical protein [Acidobacteriota bacterium]